MCNWDLLDCHYICMYGGFYWGAKFVTIQLVYVTVKAVVLSSSATNFIVVIVYYGIIHCKKLVWAIFQLKIKEPLLHGNKSKTFLSKFSLNSIRSQTLKWPQCISIISFYK